MNTHPGSAAETISNDVLDGHICGEARAVVDVRGLAVRTVCATDIVVVTAQYYRTNLSCGNGFVERACDLNATFAIGIQDAGLRPYDQFIFFGAFDPTNVVVHLLANFFRRLGHQSFKDFLGDGIGLI